MSHKTIALALVHHANQYLITNGYDNREGVEALVGRTGSSCGYLRVLELHERYGIPLHLQLSGTLIEALRWHCPEFLARVRELLRKGLIHPIGSAYGQNILRYFEPKHNRRQLNEGLRLYADCLRTDPKEIKIFWPPERVWDTESMAPVLTDASLLNGGYEYVLIDDRLLYPLQGTPSRRDHDGARIRRRSDFAVCRMQDSRGLAALPIATTLRHNVPPRDGECSGAISELVWWLCSAQSDEQERLVAIYGDDMEKAAGAGPWEPCGTAQYELFLEWVRENPSVQPVRLDDWLRQAKAVRERRIDHGSYLELANQFGAGEGYEKWYFSPGWRPYRDCSNWAQERVQALSALGADRNLIELAWKQLLAAGYETAWHTPSYGVHGDRSGDEGVSPWAKAVASHSRHAAVTAEAAYWMQHKDGKAHAHLADLDDDGEMELVLKSNALFAVIAPKWGGRLVYLFSVSGERGRMVIGNPCDDWNWMEELNKYMEVPANHPGALADKGFEHDAYSVSILAGEGAEAVVRLRNIQPQSAAHGLTKEIWLPSPDRSSLEVSYTLPEGLPEVETEFGMSPDYLNLLRGGREVLETCEDGEKRGCRSGAVSVWIRPAERQRLKWVGSYRNFGHGVSATLSGRQPRYGISIEVDASGSRNRLPVKEQRAEMTISGAGYADGLRELMPALSACVEECFGDGGLAAWRVAGFRKKLRKFIVELEIFREGVAPLGCIAKFDEKGQGRHTFESLSMLWSAGLRPPAACTVAQPITYKPAYGLLLQEKAPGRPLADFLLQNRRADRGAVARAATALAALHGTAIRAEPRLANIRAAVARYRSELAEALPSQASKLERLAHIALEKLHPCPGELLVPSHGDFHSKNIFLDEARVTLIDMDTYGGQEREADVAYFLVQTAIRARFHNGSFAAGEADNDAFLRAYQEAAGPLSEDRIALYQGIGLLQSLHYELCVLHTKKLDIAETWLGNCELALVEGTTGLAEECVRVREFVSTYSPVISAQAASE